MAIDLQDGVTAAAKSLGPVSVEWWDAAEVPGGPSRPARFRLSTPTPRPASIGGGHVAFTGHVHVDGNVDWIDGLNAIGRTVANLFADTGAVLACVENAYEERDAARRRARAAESRLERVLSGGRALSEKGFHVSVAADGSAWLQCPEKRDAGFGFRFASLADLWRVHPDLRPVEWGQDERGPFLTVKPIRLGIGE